MLLNLAQLLWRPSSHRAVFCLSRRTILGSPHPDIQKSIIATHVCIMLVEYFGVRKPPYLFLVVLRSSNRAVGLYKWFKSLQTKITSAQNCLCKCNFSVCYSENRHCLIIQWAAAVPVILLSLSLGSVLVG